MLPLYRFLFYQYNRLRYSDGERERSMEISPQDDDDEEEGSTTE